MRLREPRATALIFASGKICVTGIKSTHNATLASKKFHYIIEKIGFKPKEYMDFKVQNICGTADVGFPVRLEGLVYAHSAFASYEPELFPGLIYRMVSPRVVFLIFVSGKLVITGAKKESDLANALTKVSFGEKNKLSKGNGQQRQTQQSIESYLFLIYCLVFFSVISCVGRIQKGTSRSVP
jgi:transcription initiation factor TFIID TATA-box-binding protein